MRLSNSLYLTSPAVTHALHTCRGQEFFVHPLDLTFVATDLIGSSGKRVNATVCVNTFRYNTLNPQEFSGDDLNVGAPFMRNVYAS